MDKPTDKELEQENIQALQGAKNESDENEKGASLVEYAVLAALIVVLAIAAIQLLGRSVSKQFSIVSDAIS